MTDRLSDQSGSVLATVLVVLIILLSIFLTAMTYALARYSHHVADQNRLMASHLSDAGVAHVLARLDREGFRAGDDTWQAPNGGEIVTDVTAWGPYVLVRSRGEYGNQAVETSALIGSSGLSIQDAAITVCDESNPLVVAGRTRIVGDVNTGSQGIMEGRFRGEGVAHRNYLIGTNVQHARLEVPPLDTTVLDIYKREMKARRRQVTNRLPGSVILGPDDSGILATQSLIRVESNLQIRDAAIGSRDGIKSIFVDCSVEILGHTRLSGLLEIVAEGAITVGDSAVIDNVILMARDSVVFSDASRSSAIAISEGRIVVRDRARLVYPSLLLADVPEGPSEPTGGMYLSSRGSLESVCYAREKPFQHGSPERLLYIDTTAVIQGVLISQGYSDLRGRLDGCSVTERFHFDCPPTTYVNWLKDAYIDRPRLDFTPVLPVLETTDSTAGYFVVRKDRVS